MIDLKNVSVLNQFLYLKYRKMEWDEEKKIRNHRLTDQSRCPDDHFLVTRGMPAQIPSARSKFLRSN